MKRFVWSCGVLATVAFAGTPALDAQGVTTAAIAGIVTDSSGTPLEAARVIAVHGPSGTTYTASTRTDGRFTISGMRVGGPYRVTVTVVGHRRELQDQIHLTLGGTADLRFVLAGECRVGARDRHRHKQPRVQLVTDRGRYDHFSRADRPPTDHQPSGRGPAPAHAPVQSYVLRVFVRRSGQPVEQHDDRRLVLQQLIRAGGAAR